MGKLQRTSRERRLTTEEAAQDESIRERVMEEFPPVPPPLVRRAAALLRAERERQQISQAAAAKKTGLSREVICRLETQPGNATIGTLERYARGLGVQFEIALAPASVKRKVRQRSA